ncbi:MAG: hypothetical protein WKF79_10740 [Nocardioides sp.]
MARTYVDPGALLDGALGVELGGHVGAADEVPALGPEVAHGLQPGAEHNVVDREHPRLAPMTTRLRMVSDPSVIGERRRG